jgi:hypothetical protein
MEGSFEHGNETSGSINAGKFLSSCTSGRFSRRTQLHEISYFFILPYGDVVNPMETLLHVEPLFTDKFYWYMRISK